MTQYDCVHSLQFMMNLPYFSSFVGQYLILFTPFFLQNVARIVVFVQVRNSKKINCNDSLYATVVVTISVLY